MAYDKQTWVTGELITAEKLNHMENGIEDNNPTDAQVATAVGEWLAENVDPVGSAVTVDSTLSIPGSAGDAKKTGELVAPVFDSTATYAIGDYCLYQGTLYRFVNAHTGAWDVTDVTPVDVGAEVGEARNALSNNIVSITLNDCQNQGYLKIDGTINATDPGWRYSDYISVKAGETYSINAIGHPVVASVAFYDASKTYVSSVSAPSADAWKYQKSTVPENIAYIRVTYHAQYGSIDAVNAYKQHFSYVSVLPNVPDLVTSEQQTFTESQRIQVRQNLKTASIGEAFLSSHYELVNFQYDEEYFVRGMRGYGYLKTYDASIANDQGWWVSPFFEIDQGTTVKYNLWGHPVVASIALYDKGMKYISNVHADTADTMTTGEITTPSEAKFLRFTLYINTNNTNANRYSQYIQFYGSVHVSEYGGKKVAFLGDSFTQQALYVNEVVDILHCDALNYGVSGTGYIAYNDTDNFASRISSMDANADYVVVFGGINDFGPSASGETRNFQLGTISDSIGDGTMYGKVKQTLTALLTKYPSKKILVITPCKCASSALATEQGYSFGRDTNSYGVGLSSFAEAIVDCAKLYSLPILDLYNDSGWNDYTIPTMTNDGLHPNATGAKLLGRQIAEFIKQF